MRCSPQAALFWALSFSSILLSRPVYAQVASQPASARQTESASNSPATSTPEIASLRLEIDRGKYADALKQLDVLAALQPVPAGVYRLQGLALYSEDKFVEADAAFASALKQDPHDTEAMQMRGLTLFRLGHPAEAVSLLEPASDWTAHTRVDPSYVLALCYIDLNQFDNARHAFARQYGFGPDSGPAYLLTARMLLRSDNLPAAQQFAQKAADLDPQLPLAHALLGEIALAQQKVDVAITEFEKERARNPLEGSIYDRLGDAYIRKGDYNQAEQILQRALLLEPSATGPFILLGKALLLNQDPAGAAMYLERAEKMDGKNTMTHWLLARAYRSLGRADDARRESEMTEKLQPAN